MSTLIVEVVEIKEIKPHPNAERLEIACIKGWECCVVKDQYKVGDLVVYFPPDSVLTEELANRLGVAKYLSKGRVRVTSLRGYHSYGLLIPNEGDWPQGTDLVSHYGINKYEPPVKTSEGDEEREFGAFHKYYSMENIKNFPNLFTEGEEVIITEKIHGQNVRVGLIYPFGEMTYCAGSHNVNRKEFLPDGKRSVYWECLDKCRDLLLYLSNPVESDAGVCQGSNVIIYGERFGQGVQDLTYGVDGWDFRAFDIMCSDKYVPANLKMDLFKKFNIKTVPILYQGPFSMKIVEELTNGKSFSPSVNFPYKEGVVITTVMEQSRSLPEKHFARVQAKSISFEYLNRKGGTEYH